MYATRACKGTGATHSLHLPNLPTQAPSPSQVHASRAATSTSKIKEIVQSFRSAALRGCPFGLFALYFGLRRLRRAVSPSPAIVVPQRRRVAGSGVAAKSSMIGVMVPVKSPSPMNVRPVINAVTLPGSRFADGSMPVTSNALTPRERKTADWPRVVAGQETDRLGTIG